MLERLVMAARFRPALVSPARRCRQRGLLGQENPFLADRKVQLPATRRRALLEPARRR